MNATITLRADLTRVEAALAALDNSPLPSLEDICERPEEFFCLKSHPISAPGAYEVVVTFEPADRLLSLLAAAGAMKRYLGLIEGIAHV